MNNVTKIYMYDNATGIEIPEKIDTFPVDLLLGSTISEVHKNIDPCQLFCVFTPIMDTDIIVKTKSDADLLNTVLKFGKKDFNVSVKENSIWYSSKAETNIIFSNTVKLPATELEAIIRLFLNEIKLKKRAENRLHPAEIYTIINVRNNKVILKTPDLSEAEHTCDQNPCCVVLNRIGDQIYKSSFGKVQIPYTKNKFSSRYKAMQSNSNGIFNIKQQ